MKNVLRGMAFSLLMTAMLPLLLMATACYMLRASPDDLRSTD